MVPIQSARPLFSVRFWLICVAGLMAGFGCSTIDNQTSPVANVGQGIVGGEAETGYPAVGAFVMADDQFCTGTLVSARIVVTAAHCLEMQGTMGVFFDNDLRSRDVGDSVPVESIHPHPDYNPITLENDIGVAVLSRAAPVDPIALQVDPLTESWIGTELLFVGYGVTRAWGRDNHLKRSVQIPISDIGDTYIWIEDASRNTCSGDSGGPALHIADDGVRLIAVTSWGDPNCSIFGVSTRVDAYLSFIQPFITSYPADYDICETEGRLSDGDCDLDCATADPDCGEDECIVDGVYGDGFCDESCEWFDPDCETDECVWWSVRDYYCDYWCEDSDPDCDDHCVWEGRYYDGTCDEDCPSPDPDCAEDFCAIWDLYGNGHCDWECEEYDPDCDDWDECEAYGHYGDGRCDLWCPEPDPDCDGEDDWCEVYGRYGDGFCDWDCPRPDPDCDDENDWCEENGRYGDGNCDWDCPRPDPDCYYYYDWCEEDGLYGDGVCDWGCPEPDPDCDDVGDWCEENGLYGDGQCDWDCPRPDPDCDNYDWCEMNGLYGDGWCDWDCPRPDPDCDDVEDWCEHYGRYGDGVCDPECPRPDPDCADENDWCAEYGFYGDGTCDTDCPQPDPDCTFPDFQFPEVTPSFDDSDAFTDGDSESPASGCSVADQGRNTRWYLVLTVLFAIPVARRRRLS